MENIKTCELCLEQIIKTEDVESLYGDGKEDLRILKNLEINVSRDAKTCSNCVNVSHVTYYFKTSCLTNNDYLKTLIHPGINDKLILEEVILKETKSESKNEEKVCRFCLNFSDVNLLMEINLDQDVIIKDMLERCLPEIDMYIVQNPLICYICNERLEKLFSFISQSENAKVLRNLDTKTDILVNEHSSTVTVANNDDNIDKSFVKEENCEGLEDPELQIKSEDLDIDEDIKHSINDSNCLLKEGEIHAMPSSFPSGLTHQQTHWKTRKSTIRKLYKCTKCFFQTKHQTSLVRHKKLHEMASKCNMCSFTANNKCEIVKHKKEVHMAESGLYKCQKCPYITKWKKDLVDHFMRWHEDISKQSKYKCDECLFETLYRCALVRHKITHRDPSEVNMYKCMKCSYVTKRKYALRNHEKKHTRNQQNAVKVEQSLSNHVEEKDVKPKLHATIKKKFVCDICLYQTTTKFNIERHYLIHEKTSEVNTFKCDYCPFATKWMHSLTLHTIRHHKEVNLFKCDYCSFATKWKKSLTSHTVCHTNLSKFKCNDCPYESNTKRDLISHFLVHKNPSQIKMFKCNDCSYTTNKKQNLASHSLVHKNPSQLKMYKCKVCPYQTKYGHTIQVHEKKHQAEIYTCDKCSYKTTLKRSFVVHLQYHKARKQPAKPVKASIRNPKQVNKSVYKCNECSYVVNLKSSLKIHQKALSKITLQRHYKKNHSDLEVPFGELKTFRCNECDYETTHSKCISIHIQAHNRKRGHQT